MSKIVKIGNALIGGNESVKIQSMTTTKTSDVDSTVKQIQDLQNAGCDIIRVAISSDDDAKAIKKIKEKISIPLVADIQFSLKQALLSIENGVDKVRVNPGNFGGENELKQLADCIKAYNIPVRVGSNTGSVNKEFLNKYGKNEVSLVESALQNVSVLEKLGVNDIVISVKASSVPLTIKAYRLLKTKCDYPLHLGVTEAGTNVNGIIKSSIGIGSLLCDGIGDTIRVSLSGEPIQEIYTAKRILRACGLDKNFVEIIACPTCGRTEYPCASLAEKLENITSNINKSCKIAVMGCVVNGPGEAKDCDLGIAGGKDFCLVFKKGEIVKKIPSITAEQEFIDIVKDYLSNEK